MKTHYSAAELAVMKLPGLPGTERGIHKNAKKNLWVSRNKLQGKGIEYDVSSLPKAVRLYLLMQQIDKEHHHEIAAQAGSIDQCRENGEIFDTSKRASVLGARADGNEGGDTATPGGRPDGGDRAGDIQRVGVNRSGNNNGRRAEACAAGVRSGADAAAGGSVGIYGATKDLNKKQRETHRAISNIVKFVKAYCGPAESALTHLNDEHAAGRLNPGLRRAYQNCWDKKRKNSRLNRDTFNKWIRRFNERGHYAPMKVEKDMSIKPWHGLAITLCKRPQGSTKRWIYSQLQEQLGEQAPSSYDVMCAFFRHDFSAMDQLKGRYSGSQLRGHKFYQHRTSAGLAPADEIHADGWNTHFTAPHPVTGEFVTYEVWHFHDVATRYVTQPGIGLTENADVIAKGLENCVRELGVPVHLQTDSTRVVRGNDKFTKAMHSLEERLGFTWVHPKEVGNSQANGIAENFNASWLDKRSRELATYQNKNSMDDLAFKRIRKITAAMVKAAAAGDLVERDKKLREAARMGKGLVFESYQQALDWIRQIMAEYNDRPHRALKKIACPTSGKQRHQTPREALQEHIANGWEATRLSEAELVDAFRPHVVVKVTRETVTPYGGMRFRNAEVLGHWNGKEVVVAYDMDDYSRVVVKDTKGALICEAEFVGATGYRGQTAREAGDEKRALATLKRIDKKRDAVLARNPGVQIEGESTPVKTIADFMDVTPQPAPARELTILDFLPAAKQEEPESTYSDTVMWLHGGGKDPRDKGDKKEVAAK